MNAPHFYVMYIACLVTLALPSMALRSYNFAVRQKGKAVPLHALKANGGLRGIAPTASNLNI
jgi:hypothetical protein